MVTRLLETLRQLAQLGVRIRPSGEQLRVSVDLGQTVVPGVRDRQPHQADRAVLRGAPLRLPAVLQVVQRARPPADTTPDAYARQQILQIERLRDVVVSPALEAH